MKKEEEADLNQKLGNLNTVSNNGWPRVGGGREGGKDWMGGGREVKNRRRVGGIEPRMKGER